MSKVTVDQTPSRDDERKRVIEDGSWITTKNGVPRVDGELTVTRAIGDLDLKKFIISEPEITQMTIEEGDDLLVLSSDGLMRVFNHETLTTRLH